VSQQKAGLVDGTKNNLEQNKQAQEKEFNRLISEGYLQEQQNQLSEAIGAYKRAMTIHADGKVSSHVHDLEQRIELERKKEKQFSKLIKDGYAKEKAGDLRSAIDRYREALQIKSDVKVESHIHDLEMKYNNDNRSQKVVQENSTPWSGTYHSKESFAGGHTVQDLTLHLIQKGEQLSGQITLKLFTQGNPYSNDTSSVNGSCHGRTGTIVVNGESMKLNLSPDGNSLTDTDGLSLKRVK
jgi:tetratricopeptide (TPR) repeat protein